MDVAGTMDIVKPCRRRADDVQVVAVVAVAVVEADQVAIHSMVAAGQ